MPLDQPQYMVTNAFHIEIQLTSPLFPVLPNDFGQKYIQTHKPTFLQSNAPETQSNYYGSYFYDNVFSIYHSFYFSVNVEEIELTFEPALIKNFNLPYETIKFMKE